MTDSAAGMTQQVLSRRRVATAFLAALAVGLAAFLGGLLLTVLAHPLTFCGDGMGDQCAQQDGSGYYIAFAFVALITVALMILTIRGVAGGAGDRIGSPRIILMGILLSIGVPALVIGTGILVYRIGGGWQPVVFAMALVLVLSACGWVWLLRRASDRMTRNG
jgi:hypothetical protein